jgi:hypothetical protein
VIAYGWRGSETPHIIHQNKMELSVHFHSSADWSSSKSLVSRSQLPRGLRRRSAVARLLRLWVRIHYGNGCLCVVSVVLSGRGLCDELITRPEESYQLWCVVVCDLKWGSPDPLGGCRTNKNQTKSILIRFRLGKEWPPKQFAVRYL